MLPDRAVTCLLLLVSLAVPLWRTLERGTGLSLTLVKSPQFVSLFEVIVSIALLALKAIVIVVRPVAFLLVVAHKPNDDLII